MTTIPDGSPLPPSDMAANWYAGEIAARQHDAQQQPQPAPTSTAAPAPASEPLADLPDDVSRAAEYYTLPDAMLPDGILLPDGTKLEPNKAMLDAALPILHRHKITREAFHDLVRAFSANELADFNNGRAYLAEANRELGAGAEAIRKDLAGQMRNTGAADFADAFAANAPAFVVSWLRSVLAGRAPTPPSLEQRWYGR